VWVVVGLMVLVEERSLVFEERGIEFRRKAETGVVQKAQGKGNACEKPPRGGGSLFLMGCQDPTAHQPFRSPATATRFTWVPVG
jgi:hypothetical protein